MRCEASERTSGVCKRCEKGRHRCEYQVPEVRPKNTKLTKRIEQLEKTISHLKARSPNQSGLISHHDGDGSFNNQAQSDRRLERLEQTLLEYTSQLANAVQQPPPLPSQPSTFSQYSTNQPIQLPSISPPLPFDTLSYSHSPSLNPLDFRDAIDQGLISLPHATALLSSFRIMCHSFPYVIIPPTATVSSLRISNPMLLLALLAAAAWQGRNLQLRLEKAYLRVLGLRMVVEGEQSLDMLQSLLVHLAWCHFHLKSAYRLTAYANSLVVNMGLNRPPQQSRSGAAQGRQKLGVLLPFPNGSRAHSPEADPGGNSWSAVARRTYIGTYVISTSYSHALRKAGVLRYTPYLLECATSLPIESGLPSDEILIHYVRLVHHAEQVSDTFNYDSASSSAVGIGAGGVIGEEQLAFYVRTFNASFAAITAQIPARFANSTMLATYSLMVSAYTQEIGLHGFSTSGSTSDNVLSITRTTILIDCLVTVRKVLDIVMNLTPLEFNTLFGFSWARTHYILNLACELSIGIDSPSWSVESVRSIIELEVYIDAYVARLEEQSKSVSRRDGEKDWFAFMAVQWKKLRNEYVEGMRRRGVVVGGGMEQWSPGWEGLSLLGEMDFMPQEWFWDGGDVVGV